MVEKNYIFTLYKIPSTEILKNRKAFYSLQKENDEPIGKWLERIQSWVSCCEFPNFAEYIGIDKFFCELNNDEIESLRHVDTLSLKQLTEDFINQNIHTRPMNTNASVTENIGLIQRMPSVDVKREFFIDDAEKKPLIIETHALQEENSTRIDIEMKSREKGTSIPTNDAFDVKNELQIDDMKCEIEGYEYSQNDSVADLIYKGDYSVDLKPHENYEAHNENVSHPHKLLINGGSLYSCEICDKRFKSSTTLRLHTAIHKVRKAYSCNLCGKTFTRPCTVTRHKKAVHEQIRAHSCEVCGKRFSHAFDLSKHERIHTGKRPHPCGSCYKTFTTSSGLMRHIKSVHYSKNVQTKHT